MCVCVSVCGGLCNASVCVCVDYVMRGCVCVDYVMRVCVCMCGFCNVCVYVWVF